MANLETNYTNNNLFTPKKDSTNLETSKVRVIIRVRGLLPNEIPSKSCISSSSKNSDEEVSVCLKDPHSCRNESYNVDSFYGQEENDGKSNVRQIFEREVMPLIPGVVNGSNATVFAYGATGSGKTFTMQGSDELPGLMPMAASTILSMCENTQKTVEISYYEIYLERCYDLLDRDRKEITILDDKDGHPHPVGLSKVLIHSMNDFQQAFFRGAQRRKVAHTSLNDVSSRSHGVLVINVTEGPGSTLIGKLNLIDLAGNEDNKRSGNEGVRLTESTKINQSLFALSQVIYALNNNTRIPFRDSKLTRILQDSLGGTSHALMVACLNPREYEQSVHTVSLAARSRRISNFCHSSRKHNTPEIQVDMEAKLRAWLESKGKTKSAKRKNQSQTLTPTPRSVSSMKKYSTFQSSGKPKAVHTLEQYARKVENATTPMFKERKVLSPINSNVNIDPVTSQQQSFIDDKTQNTVTPLNKLRAMSCNLKNTLAQEYVNFLNTAGKLELMQLKGIGEKMADYILELRDASPLESLNDLEKIGLSSKQVGNMFGRTAKGLFD
uniref:kinesin-like protein KIN-10C n=1 Tax=Erigeron canadensis TaxID=72917 RepID=UPI001CB8BCF6|nr:kinesin-like protein KIN-10C [Erigeron canadensis]